MRTPHRHEPCPGAKTLEQTTHDGTGDKEVGNWHQRTFRIGRETLKVLRPHILPRKKKKQCDLYKGVCICFMKQIYNLKKIDFQSLVMKIKKQKKY